MSEIKKIVLPKEVAEAIEGLRRLGWNDYNIINAREFVDVEWKPIRKSHVYSRRRTSKSHRDVIAEWLSEGRERLTLLASAIINGYTVESTPEEKVREYYDQAAGDAHSGDYDIKFTGEARMEAIEFFANAYGIKIEGINA